MRFDVPGYPLIFIQKELCKDTSAHEFTYIYKFRSPATRYNYILRADYHNEDVFGIKFYAQPHRHSDLKYSKITNRGDVPNILVSCLSVVPILLAQHPTASFGFIGARTVDKASQRIEGHQNTQRYRIYKELVKEKIGELTFEHVDYEQLSGYLLLNRAAGNLKIKEAAIIDMFTETYNNLLDV
ncbi:hypothetical protein [Pedobacter sp. KLB.chiD]|uniref:hypothetical protein n=1 Tax=Pedobacter sp. KLB.chiD TaxID=3387402 RepID=UPI00399B6A9A